MPNNNQPLIFDDLAAPRYSALQKLVIWLGSKQHVDLSQAAVLGAAQAQTGLDDFGPHEFRERLQVLLDDYNSDPDISKIGRAQMFADLTRCARNRLLIQDRFNTTENWQATELPAPLAVAGLPRSGTTHLVNLLAADTRFQSLPLWKIQEPFHVRGKERAATGLKFRAWLLRTLLQSGDTAHQDPRYLRCSLRWSGMQLTGPKLAAMHPMNPDHIHEELEIMTYDFSSNQFEWTSVIPGYRDYYLAHDQTPHYEYLRDVLKLLFLEEGSGRPFVLKCVQNPEQLPAMKHALPHATALFTHRDPVAVIQSTATMLAYGHRILRTKVEPKKVLAYWADRFELLLKAFVRDRHVWPQTQSLDIQFADFMADQHETLERIYVHHGWELNDQARQQIQHFIDTHPRGKFGRVQYKLKEHFGVEPDQLRERFAFYFDAFGVKPEV